MKLALVILLCAISAPAGATRFTDLGQDLTPRARTTFTLHGLLRLRSEALYDLDLDRGLTPSGDPLYPVPLADQSAQTLYAADLRLRGDLAVYSPGGGVAVKMRVDVLDGHALGGDAVGAPQGATAQDGSDAFLLRRAWAEAATPIGVLAVGRMGAHWGLGMLANGGDCSDCDGGDSADRAAFVTPLAGLIWALAYDLTSSGPAGRRRDGMRALDRDPTDDVRTVSFAVIRWREDAARARRAAAGKTTIEWGALGSYRWQDNDVPGDYLPVAGSTIMQRGYRATAVDAWFRLSTPTFRLEAEAALVVASIDQASLIPGVLLRDPIRSTQVGAAVESEWTPSAAVGAGLDLGFASGDPAPGFGAFPRPGDTPPAPGDLDGPQAIPPDDDRVDNFRFHADYRIDRILFREIIGTVTDALYLRPHARFDLARGGAGALTIGVAAIASMAVEATSTPGGARPLGVELDPTLVYQSRDGFLAALEYAVLFPLAGLDNPTDGLAAQPAQLVRVRLGFVF